MYIQVDHKHICVLAPLSSLLHLLYTHLSLLWVFVLVFYSLPAPSLFSYFPVNGLKSFYAGRSRLTDIVSWPRQAKPLSVPDI